MAPLPEETELLFRRFVEQGDPEALGEVYDRLAPELLRIAGHISRSTAEAEDVLQASLAVDAATGSAITELRLERGP